MDLYAFDDTNGRDWHKAVYDIYSASIKRRIKRQIKSDNARIKDTNPSFDLKQYTGKYSNEMFGEITVEIKNGRLCFDLNNYTYYKLEHWHYNTFRSDKNLEWRYRVFLNFPINTKGKIDKVQYSGPYIDVDFMRVKK